MRKILTIIVYLVSCIPLLAGCAADTKYYAVRDHKPLLSTLGFSIIPPPGKNWYESHQDQSLLFLKLGKNRSYAITTKATEIVLNKKFAHQNDFMNYVKKIKKLHRKGKNFVNASSVFSWKENNSPYCIRYQQDYEDHNVKNLRHNKYVKVKNIGLVCMHPEFPKVGIDISYLEKFISGTHSPSHRDEGEKFLSSLMFYHKSPR